MTTLHDAEVRQRFDEQAGRFKAVVPSDDIRLNAVLEVLPDPTEGWILDLGCGQGRFARRLIERGYRVFGLDLSGEMLARAHGMPRVLASSRRLPFADETFAAVVSIEVFEHLGRLDGPLAEVRRVLKPGGLLAIIDKNAGALNADRPWLPALLVKWIDERRGRWMYPAGGPVRERWFWPISFKRELLQQFNEVGATFLLTPKESARTIFRMVPGARLLALWTARKPEDPR